MTVHRVTFPAIIILVFSVISAQAQQKTAVPKTTKKFLPAHQHTTTAYSPSLGRLTLQFGSGALLGAGGGVLGGLASIAFVPNEGNSASGFANMGAFMLGGYISYTVFSSLGTYIIANNQVYDASLGNILLGNVLGAAAGVGGLAALGQSSTGIGATLAFAFPVIGGMVANTMSIKKRNSGTSALLNIRDSQLSISSPSVRLTKVGDVSIADKLYSPTVKLLNISL